ncbi:MAG: ATP-binding protein [Sneathiellales bacterium]|nr:ATP-binding protein [Sneathiellales bacterium]
MDLAQKNSACVSLLLLSDEPTIVQFLQSRLTDPNICFSTASLLDQKNLASVVAHTDVLVFFVGKYGFQHTLRALKSLQNNNITASTLIIDCEATPERAVSAMKAGADDYRAFSGDEEELVHYVEQSCLDNLFTQPKNQTIFRDSRSIRQLKSLNLKVGELVKAAGRLATCNSLQEVCENLLETLGEVLGATGGSLYLTKEGYLEQVHSLDPGHAPETLPLPLEEGSVFEKVYSTGEPVLMTGKDEIGKLKSSGWAGYEGDNLLVYPLVLKTGEPIGIFSLHGKKNEGFTREDRDIVLILASYSRETLRALYAQEQSAEMFDSLRLTFENMNEGIVLLNGEGDIVHFNRNFLEITDLKPDCVKIGQNIEELYSCFFERGDAADKMQGKCPWSSVAEDYEYLHRCHNGTMVNVSGNYIEEGGFVLTFTDITRQKEWEVQLYKAKEKAEAASASKTNFLASVSHELRTPLNAIIGFAEMINSEVFGALNNDRYSEYVKHIHDSGSHLLHLINNLLDLSKVEAGKFELQESDVHLSDLISKTISYCEAQATEKGVTIVLNEAKDIGLVRADENALRQILLNLLSNAIKFTPKDGLVTVFTDMTLEGEVRIAVQDTGIGMEEKSISIALQPFGQVENAFNRKYPGTGLGLPLVASLVELHGGNFDIKSSLGVGTTCCLNLPAKKAA